MAFLSWLGTEWCNERATRRTREINCMGLRTFLHCFPDSAFQPARHLAKVSPQLLQQWLTAHLYVHTHHSDHCSYAERSRRTGWQGAAAPFPATPCPALSNLTLFELVTLPAVHSWSTACSRTHLLLLGKQEQRGGLGWRWPQGGCRVVTQHLYSFGLMTSVVALSQPLLPLRTVLGLIVAVWGAYSSSFWASGFSCVWILLPWGLWLDHIFAAPTVKRQWLTCKD